MTINKNIMKQVKYISFFLGIISFLFSCKTSNENIGETTITKWQYNKNAAVSITFDDGIITHFRVALPLLEKNGFPGTFYLITGSIPGSVYTGEFVGRDIKEIISETSLIHTNGNNFFERASAIRYLGYENMHNYYSDAAEKFRNGSLEEAYDAIDYGYEQVRIGSVKSTDNLKDYIQDVMVINPDVEMITWDELRTFDSSFHEFGSHTVTHPNLAILDENNILYEIIKSKEEIQKQLGDKYIFSVEAPFGIEEDRVMEYLYENYFASRNRMPEPWLTELNRGNRMSPSEQDNEYVQWQRGPLTKTPMDVMKSWIDTIIVRDNIWLTLVFHGVEGVGWEPRSKDELKEYFEYIKEHENSIWVATFADVAKYLKQRMNTEINVEKIKNEILVHLDSKLDELYTIPLTLKTKVSSVDKKLEIIQNNKMLNFEIIKEGSENFAVYQAYPSDGPITLIENK